MIDLLYTWVEKIKSNNATDVARLYHQDGLLLGTFSNYERKGEKQILDYFKELFNAQVDVEIKQNISIKLNLYPQFLGTITLR